MSVDVENIEQFKDQRVKIVRNVDGEDGQRVAEELIATVTAASTDVILVRPKGRTSQLLIDVPTLESISLDDDAIKDVRQRTLRPVKLGDARQHLADRHGWTLFRVNRLTEETAFAEHEAANHDELSHCHKEPEEVKASEDTEATESDVDSQDSTE